VTISIPTDYGEKLNVIIRTFSFTFHLLGIKRGSPPTCGGRVQAFPRPATLNVPEGRTQGGRRTDGRMTLREAAIRLGVSEGAIRKRVARGTVRSELDADGKRYVCLDAGMDGWVDASSTHESSSLRSERDELIESKDRIIAILENQLAEERTSSAELRRIVAALTQRIPEIEAGADSTEPHESREEVAQEPARGGARVRPPGDTGRSEDYGRPRDTAEFPVRGSLVRPWWRRIYG
jgi:hypothetical protein